ncbi:hypothetical protein, partial [Actinomadura sp. LOL_011]|uniref:hypothetical protein n=1 Tax=Actinomadura sp. LOL_011 TaxID=3345410 RepID=UPI003A7FA07C
MNDDFACLFQHQVAGGVERGADGHDGAAVRPWSDIGDLGGSAQYQTWRHGPAQAHAQHPAAGDNGESAVETSCAESLHHG